MEGFMRCKKRLYEIRGKDLISLTVYCGSIPPQAFAHKGNKNDMEDIRHDFRNR